MQRDVETGTFHLRIDPQTDRPVDELGDEPCGHEAERGNRRHGDDLNEQQPDIAEREAVDTIDRGLCQHTE